MRSKNNLRTKRTIFFTIQRYITSGRGVKSVNPPKYGPACFHEVAKNVDIEAVIDDFGHLKLRRYPMF